MHEGYRQTTDGQATATANEFTFANNVATDTAGSGVICSLLFRFEQLSQDSVGLPTNSTVSVIRHKMWEVSKHAFASEILTEFHQRVAKYRVTQKPGYYTHRVRNVSNILQGVVASRLRCGAIFIDYFVTTLRPNLSVK